MLCTSGDFLLQHDRLQDDAVEAFKNGGGFILCAWGLASTPPLLAPHRAPHGVAPWSDVFRPWGMSSSLIHRPHSSRDPVPEELIDTPDVVADGPQTVPASWWIPRTKSRYMADLCPHYGLSRGPIPHTGPLSPSHRRGASRSARRPPDLSAGFHHEDHAVFTGACHLQLLTHWPHLPNQAELNALYRCS